MDQRVMDVIKCQNIPFARLVLQGSQAKVKFLMKVFDCDSIIYNVNFTKKIY